MLKSAESWDLGAHRMHMAGPAVSCGNPCVGSLVSDSVAQSRAEKQKAHITSSFPQADSPIPVRAGHEARICISPAKAFSYSYFLCPHNPKVIKLAVCQSTSVYTTVKTYKVMTLGILPCLPNINMVVESILILAMLM